MDNTDQSIDNLTGLFQSHYGLVLAAARRYSPFADHVDDVVQQVYVEFITGAMKGKWDVKKNIAPLLFQIAKRRAQNLFRELRNKRQSNIDELAEYLTTVDDERRNDLDGIETKIETLHRCLAKLPSPHRSLVEQHYFEEVPIKEIADQLQKNVETLHRFFSRIRAKLRDCINSSLNLHHD